MIETIHIKNIQSHRDTLITLSPHVNVIKGTSHHGKSSIVRGVKWGLLNIPRGESFKSHFADASDPMYTAMEFTNGYVARQRDKTVNSYEVSGLEGDLEAIGTEVPKEVKEVTQMDEVNISDQHTGYFFLQSSPGNIARDLNTVVGLDIIDKSLKKGNKIIRDARKRSEICNEDIEETEKRLENYKFLDGVKSLIDKIEKDKAKMENLHQKIKSLKHIIREIKSEKDNRFQIVDWLTIKSRIKPIEDKVVKLEKIYAKFDALNSIALFIKKEKEEQGKFKKVISLRKNIDSLSEKTSTLENLKNSHAALLSAYTDIRQTISTQNSTNQRLKKLQEQLQQQRKKAQTCPTCGAYREHWRKDVAI